MITPFWNITYSLLQVDFVACYPVGICLQGLRKITKEINQEIQIFGVHYEKFVLAQMYRTNFNIITLPNLRPPPPPHIPV